MTECPKCRGTIQTGDNFCRECGSPKPHREEYKKYTGCSCGWYARNDSGMVGSYCPSCGKHANTFIQGNDSRDFI